MSTFFTRCVLLDDIRIRSAAQGGDGRTVEAYAAVFNAPSEVQDQDGHYREQNAPTAFNKTLAEKGQRFPVFYSHGRSIDGFPSDMFSLPLGRTTSIVPDGKGLLTVSQYNRGELADQVLESIRNGDITGMSYSGLYVKSTPQRVPRGGYRATASGGLPLVTRTEIALRELGPTPFPAYAGADIVGVRSLAATAFAQDMGALLGLNETQRLALIQQLRGTTPSEPDLPTTATPLGAGDPAEEPHQHSARSMSLRTRVHAARIARGISECTNGNQARGGDPHPSGDDRG